MRARSTTPSDPWTALYRRASASLGERIVADPESFRPAATRFVETLHDAQQRLDGLRSRGLEVGEATSRLRLLTSGLKGEPTFAGPPLLVIAGIGLGVAAIAWAVAAYEYAVGLREHTLLLKRELDARVQASREGRHLQPSTMSPPSSWPLLAVGAAMLSVAGWAWRGVS